MSIGIKLIDWARRFASALSTSLWASKSVVFSWQPVYCTEAFNCKGFGYLMVLRRTIVTLTTSFEDSWSPKSWRSCLGTNQNTSTSVYSFNFKLEWIYYPKACKDSGVGFCTFLSKEDCETSRFISLPQQVSTNFSTKCRTDWTSAGLDSMCASSLTSIVCIIKLNKDSSELNSTWSWIGGDI